MKKRKTVANISKLCLDAKKFYIPRFITKQAAEHQRKIKATMEAQNLKEREETLKFLNKQLSEKSKKRLSKLRKQIKGWGNKKPAEFGGGVKVYMSKSGELLFATQRKDKFAFERHELSIFWNELESIPKKQRKEFKDMFEGVEFHVHALNPELTPGEREGGLGEIIVTAKGGRYYPSYNVEDAIRETEKGRKLLQSDTYRQQYIPIEIIPDKLFWKKMREVKKK